MKKGLLIVYSGPSGVGKSTILEQLLKDEKLNLAFSISMTTRSPRSDEQEGVDYFYVTKERFLEAIANDEFLEHAQYVDNYYGTPAAYVEQKRNEGKNVLLEIDVQGGKQVIAKVSDVVSIFIAPPSEEVLYERLRNRGTESEEVIAKRLAASKAEIAQKDCYKYVVYNDILEETVEKVRNIILKEMENRD